MWALLALFGIALQIVAVALAVRAIRTARTSQGAAAWAVFLVAAPYVAVPAYVFLGSFKYREYVVARRDSERVISGLADLGQEHSASGRTSLHAALECIAGMPVVSGNDFELLVDGRETYDAIFSAVESAQSYVLVQYYIIQDDGIGRELRDRLIAKAKDGVSVRLIYDSVGSAGLGRGWLAALEASGARVINGNGLRGPKSRFRINFRNHRKTVIVDGLIGFTGGLNVGDEHLGLDPDYGAWRDTHVKLRGPVVSQLQLVFAEDWHWATGESLLDELVWHTQPTARNIDALIVATGPGDQLESGSLFFGAAITAAERRIWIASPYFVPENDVLSALKLAAMRGVEVKILVTGVIDHFISWVARFAYFDELLDVGVEIWSYDSGFMHQKVILVDDAFASVGTMNLDNRSCRLNFEASAVAFDPDFAAEVEAMLQTDLARSTRVTKSLAEQTLRIRFGAPMARLFAPLL